MPLESLKMAYFERCVPMKKKKQDQIKKELDFFENQNISNAGAAKLRDRYKSALIVAYNAFRKRDFNELRGSLIVGLMGGNVFDSESAQECIEDYNRNFHK